MDALEKWIIIRFTPLQTTTLPKWMFSQRLLFKSSLLLNGLRGIQVGPQTNSDNFCLPFPIYPSSMGWRHEDPYGYREGVERCATSRPTSLVLALAILHQDDLKE